VRVLVVEDEQRLAANVARALREGAGYAVDVADDGQEGLYLATSGEYDLLVLDLMLPKMDGQTLLTRYRAKGHQTPVLVLTARDEKEWVVRPALADHRGCRPPFRYQCALGAARATGHRALADGIPCVGVSGAPVGRGGVQNGVARAPLRL
jgi:CheY-like chemotaxis protein